MFVLQQTWHMANAQEVFVEWTEWNGIEKFFMSLHSLLLASSTWMAWFPFLAIAVGDDWRKPGGPSCHSWWLHNSDNLLWWRTPEAVPTKRIYCGWDENPGGFQFRDIRAPETHKKVSFPQATSLSQSTLLTTLLPSLCCEKMKFRDLRFLLRPQTVEGKMGYRPKNVFDSPLVLLLQCLAKLTTFS